MASPFFPKPRHLPLISFSCAVLCMGSIAARTILFVISIHFKHPAAVIGWPFLWDITYIALVGTMLGLPLGLWAESLATHPRMARAGLWVSCLLLPAAFFCGIIFPSYFMHGVNFDLVI